MSTKATNLSENTGTKNDIMYVKPKCTTNVIDIYQVCLELDLEQRGNKIHKSTISRNKIADQICQCQKKAIKIRRNFRIQATKIEKALKFTCNVPYFQHYDPKVETNTLI